MLVLEASCFWVGRGIDLMSSISSSQKETRLFLYPNFALPKLLKKKIKKIIGRRYHVSTWISSSGSPLSRTVGSRTTSHLFHWIGCFRLRCMWSRESRPEYLLDLKWKFLTDRKIRPSLIASPRTFSKSSLFGQTLCSRINLGNIGLKIERCGRFPLHALNRQGGKRGDGEGDECNSRYKQNSELVRRR